MADTQTANMWCRRLPSLQDFALYRDLSWEGSFEDYLQIVRAAPAGDP